ncbi:MAG: glycoside hydrolase family 66 protein, partial [Oscillospiraceae bacterium]|nr:glycoside hydrolase family 66 protein [Oscillospiraceae bacterium]
MKRAIMFSVIWILLFISACSPVAPPAGTVQASDPPAAVSLPPPGPTSGPTEIIKELTVMSPNLIADLYTDKSRYAPGETPVLTIELNGGGAPVLEVEIKVRHKLEVVFTTREMITVPAGGAVKDIVLHMPDNDFMGYCAEVYCSAGETLLDYGMTAVDVSSDWNVFPRYGYLTKMNGRAEDESRAVLDRLRRHHITGLFYYDVIDAHDRPLAGTADEPAPSWNTLNHSSASMQTVEDMIRIGHEYNMYSFIYNLIFGAYDDYQRNGVSEEWGLFKDKAHQKQDHHDLSSLRWESARLWLFDPGNPHWQEYYLKVHSDLLKVFDYDGIQVDSLGNRGGLYDYGGNPVALNERYGSLLSRLKTELDTRVLFNAVSGYGLSEQLSAGYSDIIYMEIWPGDGSSYTKLKTETDRI